MKEVQENRLIKKTSCFSKRSKRYRKQEWDFTNVEGKELEFRN